ncbi:MAG: NAD-binding protein [Deltaproteobacteria bacterium]|nr:NAD-binding protein [Deltaproteobacteria bacterium]
MAPRLRTPHDPHAPQTRFARLKREFDRFIHHPITEAVILLLIVISVTAVFIELALPRSNELQHIAAWVGDAITWVFVAELSVRFWVAVKKRRFFTRYWVDIIACLPLLGPLRFLRVLRLLRIFRAGALFNRRLSVFQGAFFSTLNEMTMIGTATLTLVLVSALVLYGFEGGAGGSFDGLDKAMWFSVYSMIGGEPIGGSPNNMGTVGRVVTLGLMFGGLTLFGIFIGTVSASMVTRFTTLEVTEMDLDELSGHRVVCGWNHAGPLVLEELFSSGSTTGKEPVVLITEVGGLPADLPSGIRAEFLYHLSGDYTRVDVLERAGIENARAAVLLADTQVTRSDQDRDARTVLAALTIEKLAPEIFTVAELTNRENESLLRMHGVEEIVVADEYSAVILGSASRNRGIVRVLDEILTSRYGNTMHKVAPSPRWVGLPVHELVTTLKQTHDATLIALEHGEETDGQPRIEVNPPPDRVVRATDVLLLLSDPKKRL